MTSSPLRHPSCATLAQLAMGLLSPGFDLVTALHVRGCAECEAELRRLEAVGGALLGEEETDPISEAALARTLARLDEPPPSQAERGTLDDLLRPTAQQEVAPGVRIAMIDTPHEPGACVMLLSIDPGFGVPTHGHRGAEFTHVISGALSEEGEICRSGDFMERGDDVTHALTVFGDEPCVCVVATQGFIWA